MNLDNDKAARLLKLFPVALLRAEFDVTSTTQEHIISDIVKSRGLASVLHFAEQYLERTKQHIYIYECRQGFEYNIQLPGQIQKPVSSVENGKDILTFFLELSIKWYDLENQAVLDLISLWPVRIIYFTHQGSGERLAIVKVTIMESAFGYHNDKKVKNLSKSFDETAILKTLGFCYGRSDTPITPVDLTKGIKEMLINDLVDLPSAQYKTAKSTRTEVMDEDFTLKQQFPLVFDEIMKSPIERMHCKFLDPLDTLVPYFRVNPQEGFIALTTYPPHLESANNVVNLILDKNF